MFKQSNFFNLFPATNSKRLYVFGILFLCCMTAHSQSIKLTKKVDVFGISIYSTATVDDNKLLHAAKVMAAYLDNDGDGQPDDPSVVQQMVSRNAYLFMAATEAEQNKLTLPDGEGQNLFAFETHPEGSTREGGFDATLEEVLHLISHVGYANVYPSVFGETGTTLLTQAMDIARGGRFLTIPSTYPADAWYTYDDATCDYSCQSTEYFYWALTSILGAQNYSGRLAEISQEWQLNTKQKVMNKDMVYYLLTDPVYKLPTRLPDGNYDAVNLKITKLGPSGNGSTLNSKKVKKCVKQYFNRLDDRFENSNRPIRTINWPNIERRLTTKCLK